MYHGQPGFIRYVPWNFPLKLVGFMVHFLSKYKIIMYIYNILGTAHRQCLKNDLWGEPDLSECHTPEITKLEREVESLLSNGTETKSADTVIGITNELSSSLNTTQMIFPNDVNSITNILETVLS